MEKDTLFLLAVPFEDAGKQWFCIECASLEGALRINPHWAEKIDVKRVGFTRPRSEIAALIGEDHQGCPVLVLRDGAAMPFGGKHAGERIFVKHAVNIADYLAATYGGAPPHP